MLGYIDKVGTGSNTSKIQYVEISGSYIESQTAVGGLVAWVVGSYEFTLHHN